MRHEVIQQRRARQGRVQEERHHQHHRRLSAQVPRNRERPHHAQPNRRATQDRLHTRLLELGYATDVFRLQKRHLLAVVVQDIHRGVPVHLRDDARTPSVLLDATLHRQSHEQIRRLRRKARDLDAKLRGQESLQAEVEVEIAALVGVGVEEDERLEQRRNSTTVAQLFAQALSTGSKERRHRSQRFPSLAPPQRQTRLSWWVRIRVRPWRRGRVLERRSLNISRCCVWRGGAEDFASRQAR
eukprot:scaffold707_cov240-Pinguiococcus_pyrenoidosus.AAC.22